MTENTDNPHTVTVDRLSLATALDLLREYETELEDSGADEGPYTNEVSETIERLDDALRDRSGAQSSNRQE